MYNPEKGKVILILFSTVDSQDCPRQELGERTVIIINRGRHMTRSFPHSLVE